VDDRSRNQQLLQPTRIGTMRPDDFATIVKLCVDNVTIRAFEKDGWFGSKGKIHERPVDVR
jgi:hypothetical protein